MGLNGTNHYNCNMGRVIERNGSTVIITDVNPELKRNFPKFQGGGRGFLINHLLALTSPGEWYWGNKTLYLFAQNRESISKKRVEAQTRLWGFDCSAANNVTISGIHFKAASVRTGGDRMEGGKNNVIDHCTFRYHAPFGTHYYDFYYASNGSGSSYYGGGTIDGTSGITIAGSGNVVSNCYIAHSWGMGVRVFGTSNKVTNCFIEDIGWHFRNSLCGIRIAGKHHQITNNTVQHCPGSGIRAGEMDIDGNKYYTVGNALISHNRVRDFAYLLIDGGSAGIYTNNHNVPYSNRSLEGTEISCNIITENRTQNHRVSSGIYCDDNDHDMTIHHNVIDGGGTITSGLFTHRGREKIQVYHNTFFGVKRGWRSAVWESDGKRRDKATMIYRNDRQ